MTLMAREEVNLRQAIRLAFRHGYARETWTMTDTLLLYLERTGRLRERDDVNAWLLENLPRDRLTKAICDATRNHARSVLSRGQGAEAIQRVQSLIQRLKSEGMPDERALRIQLAVSRTCLGEIYNETGRPDLALEPLQKAVDGFEQLGREQRGNLSIAFGELGNAYLFLSLFDQALEAAQKAIAIDRELGQVYNVAIGLDQIAHILMLQQRYTEADALYEEALETANAVGSKEMKGMILQHRGGLLAHLEKYDRAIRLYKQGLNLFQQDSNIGEEMRTTTQLANAEMLRGQLGVFYQMMGKLDIAEKNILKSVETPITQLEPKIAKF